jgi:hypothetical protein
MTLDELLKKNAAWLEQALKRRMFEKVDAKAIDFPEEQRERRMSELKTRIDDLSRRKAEAEAAYDRAIARERDELEAVKREKSPTAAMKTPLARGKGRRKKSK